MAEELGTETVVGGHDGRQWVARTDHVPYALVCLIDVYKEPGSPKPDRVGTGFFISRRTVVTAGHVLGDAGKPGSPFAIANVQPGYDSTRPEPAPFGEIPVGPAGFRFFNRWKSPQNPDANYDVAALILPSSPFGETQQFFGIGAYGQGPPFQNTSYKDGRGMVGMRLASVGYPTDKVPPDGGTMWFQTGHVDSVDRNLLTFRDLDSSRGEHGSPLWAMPDDRVQSAPIAVGIHKGLDRTRTHATGLRFDGVILDQLGKWRSEGTGRTQFEDPPAPITIPPVRAAAEVAAAPPEAPKEVEGAFVIESESSQVVHVLGDCPGLQNATHAIDARPARSLGEVTPVLRELGRPLCATCLDRLTPDHREAVSAALAATAPPAPDAYRVEEDFGILTIDAAGVHIWRRYSDDTIDLEIPAITKIDTDGWTDTGTVPAIRFFFGRRWPFPQKVTFLFEDDARRDAVYDEVGDALARHHP